MKVIHGFCIGCVALGAAVGVCAGRDLPDGISPYAMLESAYYGKGDKSVQALNGLRALRDPGLRPLFAAVAAEGRGARRVEAIMAIAELETPARVNPTLVSRILEPAEQARVLGEALARDAIATEQIETLLAMPSLDPFIELALRARLMRDTGVLDAARVRSMLAGATIPAEFLGNVLLAQAGEASAADDVLSRLLGTSGSEREAVLAALLAIVERERLSAAGPQLARLARMSGQDRALQDLTLRAWIRVAPGDGGAAWEKAMEGPLAAADTFRLGLIGLASHGGLRPEQFARLEGETNPVASAIGAAGRALASGEGVDEALGRLMALRYQPATEWALDAMPHWSPERRAAAAKAALLADLERDPIYQPIPTAQRAAAILAPLHPETMRSVVRRLCERQDFRMATPVLLGMVDARVPPAWDPVNEPAWPDAEAAAAAVLAAAVGLEAAAFPAELHQRLEAAAGGVPILLLPRGRAQAAWRYATILGEQDVVLARIMVQP